MHEFAVFEVCSLPVHRLIQYLWVHTKKNDNDNRQCIRMLAIAVKILVLNKDIHPEHCVRS